MNPAEIFRSIKKLMYFFIFIWDIIIIMENQQLPTTVMSDKTARDNSKRNQNRRDKRRFVRRPTDEPLKDFSDSVITFLKSREYVRVRECAKCLAFDTTEKPTWDKLDTIMLKAVLSLLSQKYKKNLIRPLGKYNRRMLCFAIDSLWVNKQDDATVCMVCYENVLTETPTITLLCNHKLCTQCFLKCCMHQGNQVLESCPMCRADVRITN